MYCEDSLGTDIDHFEPIAVAPLRAFDWLNHLLACSHCNSNQKRDAYPRDGGGGPLLIDPSTEDPAAHLDLLLASGMYLARTPKGEATIRVFGLNRLDLVQGRRLAFVSARAMLRDWQLHRQGEDSEEAAEVADALRTSPFAGVMRAMQSLPATAVPHVLGPRAAAALTEWRRVHGRPS